MKIEKNLVKKASAIIFGLILFVLIVYFGFQILGSRAADIEPREVIISEIGQNKATISWTTGVESQAVIEYGTSPTALNFFAPEAQKTKNHQVDLTLLSPSTTYYFQIRIGDKKYDNGGVPWTFTTKSAQSNTSPIVTPMNTQTTIVNPTNTPTPIQVLEVGGNSSNTPTPIQVFEVGGNSSPTPANCQETDCEKIKLNLGKGCTTQDYFRCLRSLTATPQATQSPTPTTTQQ